ncbi:integrin alpha-X-like [Haplochromis burtoni]|uniref:integrin alpha-X-like n=1 Tax=Haplochromis burtoni TaxID=8153 RepID=UPI001C2D4D82|nr:integrin alpha-X-like [Haplochromis burtoni]
MSLGLTMKSDPTAQNTVVCGPTIPNDCNSITMYNGVCFEMDHSSTFGTPRPDFIQACPPQADIAFLLDGSISVSSRDFQTMKKFVKDLIQSLLSIDTQFSVSQFSTSPQVHFYCTKFSSSTSLDTTIKEISKLGGTTYTAKAIKHVVEKVFIPQRGSRPNVKKVLIVITDGQSHDRNHLHSAAQLAESKNIVRFAIGVGNAFTKTEAKRELHTIASSPSDKHVFQVKNFNALELIRQNLQEKIFSIEGSQNSGESLKMEMSQEGFSAIYVPEGIQMSIVGANQWKGGYVQYTTEGQKVKTYEDVSLEPDSYLGYSMAIVITKNGTLTIVGAPRYKHRGVVVAVNRQSFENQKIEPFSSQYQTGEYFGAEVCTMDINNDCSVAMCRVFKCNTFMARLQSRTYKISANLSSRWIEQIGLQSAKFLLTSTASLEYDETQYIYFSTGSNSNPPVYKIEAEVDVWPEPDFTKEIIGGSLGGLAFLALLTVGLYKAGFFKSKYKQMISENAKDSS